ncbi:MAG: indolepyruvate ferredoxin oxidoreductase subunit alpha [Spirochaetaceae bacterium]
MNKAILTGNEAIARGAYEAGIQVVTGYPGTPSSEIIKVIGQLYTDDMYAEWSTNEKVAMDAGAGAAYSGRRTLVTTKQVGMNVLSDSLMYAVYTGAEAGLVVLTADDPGLFSSQNEQDNRWYSRLMKIPMLEPQDSQEAKDYIVKGIEISEKFDTPVLVRSVMRVSHSKTIVEMGERPETPKDVGKFPRDVSKYNCTAMYAKEMHAKVEQRMLDIAEWGETSDLVEIDWNDTKTGIVTSGVVHTYVRDVFPNASIMKLGMTNPIPKKKIRDFAGKVDKLIVIEELDPVIEEQIKAMGFEVSGKDIFSPCYELLPDRMREFAEKAGLIEKSKAAIKELPEVAKDLPVRSPVLCPGCPHRSSFYVMAQLKVPVAGDIGCYNLGSMPPFNAQHTMGAMGASVGVLHGMSLAKIPENRVCTIGDSTFFHSGMPPLVNMVHNGSRGVVIIMDNSTTAMTGHQDHPGLDWKVGTKEKARKVEIEPLVKAMGVEKVKTVNAFNVKEVKRGLEECLEFDGPSVLITKGECIFVSNAPKPAFTVNKDKCIACHTCFKAGCPAVVLSEEVYEKNGKLKSHIDPTLCNGCSVCSQVCPTGAIEPPKAGKESLAE